MKVVSEISVASKQDSDICKNDLVWVVVVCTPIHTSYKVQFLTPLFIRFFVRYTIDYLIINSINLVYYKYY